jgi:hypothetical protein
MEFKQQGNALFSEGRLEEAVVAFTRGIEEAMMTSVSSFASTATDSCLPLLYSNRSMVYLQLGQFQVALEDADCAICQPGLRQGLCQERRRLATTRSTHSRLGGLRLGGGARSKFALLHRHRQAASDGGWGAPWWWSRC